MVDQMSRLFSSSFQAKVDGASEASDGPGRGKWTRRTSVSRLANSAFTFQRHARMALLACLVVVTLVWSPRPPLLSTLASLPLIGCRAAAAASFEAASELEPAAPAAYPSATSLGSSAASQFGAASHSGGQTAQEAEAAEKLEEKAKQLLDTHRYREVLRDEVVERLQELGKITDTKGALQRTFLSPAGLRAARRIDSWMQEAGMRTWTDGIGNIHGRVDGPNRSAPALLLGSHMDTVADAGKFDGLLGIVSAIAAVKVLLMDGGGAAALTRPIEVIAFSDEEGVRFQSTFLGSQAVTGRLNPDILHMEDRNGVTLAQALNSMGLEGSRQGLAAVRYEAKQVWGYIEVHIEQGPVLEAEDVPLGVVLAIAGQSRLSVEIEGEQGHAGTVPMRVRRDPMAAAAAAIVAIEQTCLQLGGSDGPMAAADVSGLVCTVGSLTVWPGASNVIPGKVEFTIDVRARKDGVRRRAVEQMRSQIDRICSERSMGCSTELKHDASAVECAPVLVQRLEHVAAEAVRHLAPPSVIRGATKDKRGEMAVRIPRIISGAGHDAMAMGQLTQVGMLFVRCKGGVSHRPEEDVSNDDVYASSASLLLLLIQETT